MRLCSPETAFFFFIIYSTEREKEGMFLCCNFTIEFQSKREVKLLFETKPAFMEIVCTKESKGRNPLEMSEMKPMVPEAM